MEFPSIQNAQRLDPVTQTHLDAAPGSPEGYVWCSSLMLRLKLSDLETGGWARL